MPMQAGALPNVFNKLSLSPILLAAERGYVSTVEALIKVGRVILLV